MIDGSYSKVEEEAGVVPFYIGGNTFHRTYMLVDGIYPQWSRFVRSLPEPIEE